MCRALLVAALVAAVPGVARAEPFTAWADSCDIWARDEATGRVWNLTVDYPWACANPDVAAYTAVFEMAAQTFPAIYAYAFDHRFRTDLVMAFASPYGGTPTEPQVGVVSTAGYGDYWCAFRFRGGVWANHLKVPWDADDNAFAVLPSYTGWFDVEADQLLYDGGQVTLSDPPPPPPPPEPSTLVLLATGTFSLLLVWRRRRTA